MKLIIIEWWPFSTVYMLHTELELHLMIIYIIFNLN